MPLKILKGRSAEKDIRGYAIPSAVPFERGEPYKPPWLSPYARELWERIVPDLEALGLIKPADFAAWVAYCETWSTYRVALETVRREGIVLKNERTGMSHKHPALLTMDVSGGQLMRFAIEFGLTPAAEVRLAKPGKDDAADDPFTAPATGTGQ